MVGASVLGVFLQSLSPDRRVAMARVASLIRRAARGVRESKRYGLVCYELAGSPLFALESREKCLVLYVAEQAVLETYPGTIGEVDHEHSQICFFDLNRLPLVDIEKMVRASVVCRREKKVQPSVDELLQLWGINQEKVKVSNPFVVIPKDTPSEAAERDAARKAEELQAQEAKRIVKPTKREKTLVEKRAEAKAIEAEALKKKRAIEKAEAKKQKASLTAGDTEPVAKAPRKSSVRKSTAKDA